MSCNTRPSQKIVVVEKKSSVSRGKVCRDQIDIKYHPEVLTSFFFRRPSDRVVDLIRIAGAVAHADRRVTRRPSICWGRDIELDVPVCDLEFWRSVEGTLSSLLNLLSGDEWSFSFRRMEDPSNIPETGFLRFPPNGEIATAFSNGLDSFSVARLVASGHASLESSSGGPKSLILVTTGRKLQLAGTPDQFGRATRQVSVPFTIARRGKRFQLRESSYRTRGFIFQSLAALAAAESQSNIVVVGEAGQGSLGPWLTPVGGESPDLRTHPYFTNALREFLALVLNREIKFEHPFIWQTKGEVLKRLVEANLHTGWQSTHSCAVQARHLDSSGVLLQCGLCPNCLLRRQSLMAAGLNDPHGYDYQSISEDESDPRLRRRVAQGLMPLIELAGLTRDPMLKRIFGRELSKFSKRMALDVIEVEKRAEHLISEHRRELRSFVRARPVGSLIRELGEAFT